MPSTDAAAEAEQVRALWRRLGLPGLVDVHVHFLPQNVLDRCGRTSTPPARWSARRGRSTTARTPATGWRGCDTPCPYAHQLDALVRLGLGDDWLRAVLHDNGARLLGLQEA